VHLCQLRKLSEFTKTPYNTTIEFLLESVIASAMLCDVMRGGDDFTTLEHVGWERVADKYASVWSSLTRQFIPAFVRLGFWHVSRQKNTRFGSRSKTKCSDMRQVMSSFYLWRRTLLPWQKGRVSAVRLPECVSD
jgi:hypothetical protein